MSIDAMKQALEYTRPGAIVPVTPETLKILVDALRLAIEQAERQEPVAWRWKELVNGDFVSDWILTHSDPPPYATESMPLYTAPPQRQPLTEWRLVSESKPPEDVAVWLYEKDRGAWIGTFSYPDAEGWCFTRCYAMPYMSTEGGWDCVDAEWDDDYAPTHWMPLPAAPAHGIGGGE